VAVVAGRRAGPLTSGPLSQQLWAENADLVAAALRHPFVRGIADGTLPRERFAGYVAQDALFLGSFARAYALALVASPDNETMLTFAELIGGVRDELRLHDRYAREWGVDPQSVTALPATLAYTEFLLATAATRPVGLTAAAMTPCMRLYAHLGTELRRAGVEDDGKYGAWVATYAHPDFDVLVQRLEALVDQHAAGSPQAAAVYRRAMRLELGFFDAVWAGRTDQTT
jgi:thiaminase/transcriptional activator TenA